MFRVVIRGRRIDEALVNANDDKFYNMTSHDEDSIVMSNDARTRSNSINFALGGGLIIEQIRNEIIRTLD